MKLPRIIAGSPRRRVAVAPVLAIVCLVCACEPGGPDEPEPANVAVRITAAKGVARDVALRLAAVWEAGPGPQSRWITTVDVPVDSLNTTQSISIQLPPKSIRPSLVERSKTYIECGDDSSYFVTNVLKPRIVVYEDRDNNGVFEPDLPNSPGADRIWAATLTSYSSLLVAFEDLDEALSHEPTEIAECVRSHTGGRYTAFFVATDFSSYVSPADTPLAIELELSRTDYPPAVLGCSGYIAEAPASYSTVTYTSRLAIVDNHVALDACDGSPFTCSVGDVAASLPPSTAYVHYPGHQLWFQCAVAGSLDLLWMKDSTLKCEGCNCSWEEADAAWVIDSAAPPSNWPCGAGLEYCSTPQESVWKQLTSCSSSVSERPL